MTEDAPKPRDNSSWHTLTDKQRYEVWTYIKHHIHFAFFYMWLRFIPSVFRRVLFRTFITISPRVPITLTSGFSDIKPLQIFWWGVANGFIFSFVITIFLSWINGTLYGDDNNRLYFLCDRLNLVLYITIVPLYVGCCCVIIGIFLQHYANISEITIRYARPSAFLRSIRIPLVFLLIPAISALLIYNYIVDVIRNVSPSQIYWFLSVTNSGDIVLNNVGIYYIILNFALLSIVVTSVFCFFSLFLEIISFGHIVYDKNYVQFAAIKDEMSDGIRAFIQIYLVAKIVCILFAFNVIFWKQTDLSNTKNLYVSLIAIALMGLFFVSLPRYYLELIYRDFEELKNDQKIYVFDDIRDMNIRLYVGIVDGILFLLLTGGIGIGIPWNEVVNWFQK